MPNFRRNFIPGGTYFFTVVTAGRVPILTTNIARPLLRAAIGDARNDRPFEIVAFVLLPDHLHAIWTLPPGDDDYPTRWAAIKARFTRSWRDADGHELRPTAQQRAQGRRGVWQPRFIEHTIEDDEDLIAHVEYIHYNPVHHGHVVCPREWKWSSFHRYVREGLYAREWCCGNEPPPEWRGLDRRSYE